ncbi:hypothetical protein [Pseudomonas sp. EpS/L25]|uniref:hypothetical protein n=1 Tax=Pseudomonas sp. EpS/L25 TaxID=1749078 RepID=UPI000743D4C8|nr:hypothetical protein [Pseudomonas sp. EpS/L25]KUM42485.1 hypothetical protein AR540_01535 [Pseudomonas sp. EpS/L25]
MSKLTKFKPGLKLKQAAELLSRLIGEDLTTDDIFTLYCADWLPAVLPVHATLYRLRPQFQPDIHENYVADGRYFMEPEETAGFCSGLQMPCDIVFVNGMHAFSMRDDEGNFYALKDNADDEFIGPAYEHVDDPERLVVEPFDIFDIAAMANDEGTLPQRQYIPRASTWCISAVQLYNLPPLVDTPRPAKEQIEPPAKEPPSKNLVLAALVEIVTSSEARRWNQDSLATEIQERFGSVRGLGKKTATNLFSEVRKSLQAARHDANSDLQS